MDLKPRAGTGAATAVLISATLHSSQARELPKGDPPQPRCPLFTWHNQAGYSDMVTVDTAEALDLARSEAPDLGILNNS